MLKIPSSSFELVLTFLLLLTIEAGFSQKNIDLQANWNESLYEYNDVWGYADFTGQEFAIIGSKRHVHFIEVTDPTSPKLIDEFALGSNTSWRDIKTFNHYAYAVSEGFSKEGLVIFDLCGISDGEVVKVAQNSEVFGKAHNIFIDVENEILYVAGADTQLNGVIIFDISIPEAPQLIRKTNLPGGYIHDLFVKDNLAFCSHGNNGLYIYDVSNPAVPTPKAFTTTGGYNHSSWVIGDTDMLVFAQEVPVGMPLGVIEFSNYASNDIEVVNSFKMPLLAPEYTNNTPHNPYMVGNYAVVSYYEDGVVIFDMTDPMNPDTVAYYDTYDNTKYTGYEGCWGVYPFLPSGNILASDITNGLFVLKPTFDLPTLCHNGKSDWNEEFIDCGGVCKLCTPCIREICGNVIDDDRNGLADCADFACNCGGSETVVKIKVFLEGFYDETANEMTRKLVIDRLMPTFQPFKLPPYNYDGKESLIEIPSDAVDWVLLEARHPEQLDSIMERQAAILLNDGRVINAEGAEGVKFRLVKESEAHIVVRHKSHLAVLSSGLIDMTAESVTYDFRPSATKAMGNNQLKQKGNAFCQIAGDFDQNGIINSLDFNLWKQNSALLNQYVFWDTDGNGIINNLDFNYWKVNRSKIGEPTVRL
ncbi:MAG: choice-of-anchor B family protein [Bacteroidota bacterium]